MFNNVYIIQFDNLPNPKEACKYDYTDLNACTGT